MEKSINKNDSSTRPDKSGLARNDDHTLEERGFSLTEVLLAIGTLAVGMLFIAGVFPVSIYFTTVASERTIAATVADEAFAKIRLYDINPITLSDTNQVPIELIPLKSGLFLTNDNEFAYPSTPADISQKKYFWSAICRRIPGSASDVQVTVFVSRKAGATAMYYVRSFLPPYNFSTIIRPVPVFVSVSTITGGRADELLISDPLNLSSFINDGYTIVDDATGTIYRVLQRTNNVIRLDKNWTGLSSQRVWTMPASAGPAVPNTTGRYPCIAVYQKIIRF